MTEEIQEVPAQIQTNAGANEAAKTETPKSTLLTAENSENESAESSGKKEEPSKDAKATVPEKYELKLPEGSLIDPKHLEEVAALAKARGLSNEDAQAQVERESNLVSTFVKSQQDLHEKQVNEWVSEIQNDKELGGAEFKKNIELASRVMRKFGTEKLTQELNTSGLGNHPELVRFCARIAKASAEDSLILGGREPSTKKSAAQVFFGNTTD